MCRATTIEGGFHRPSPSPSPRLDIRAFYLRLSCSTAAPAPAELTLAYHPAIGGAALVLNGRALPPTAPAEVTLRRVAGDAYASADRVVAAEGARFEVRAAAAAGEEVAAEGVFLARRRGGEGWRVECRRGLASVCVAEVVVLAEGGVLMRDKARAPGRGRMRCGATRLEGIPEEATDLGAGGWGRCECGACSDDSDDDGWEVVEDSSDDGEPWKQEEEEGEVEMETVRWAMEMGVWAVCLGVGILATARRFRRKRAFW